MSDSKMTEKTTPARREKIRVRVEHLRQSRQRSLIGLPELAGLAASTLILLAVIFAYLFFLRPAYARLDAAQLQREETYNLQRRLQQGVKLNEDKEVTVTTVNQSVLDFEANRLSSRSQGRITLLDTLNKLIRSNGLRNTSGPNYTALDPLAAGTTRANSTRTGNARWQSLYPGLGVTVTVEGAYPNLRHFVRELETNNQFIIINSVELEKATDSSAPVAVATAPAETPGAAAAPVAHGSLVSLRLDMTAYFRREAAPGTETVPTSETR
jgi:Tfp pilus assembly protein PilO